MSNEHLIETENATVLACGAFLVGQLAIHIVNNVIGVAPEKDGDRISTTVVEELALSEFQRRIIARGG